MDMESFNVDVIEDGGPPGLAPQGHGIGGPFGDHCRIEILCASIAGATFGVGGCVDFDRMEAITGMGERYETLSVHQQQTFFKWSYITIIFYNLGLAFVKVSILLLYLRVLRDLNYRKACYIALSLVAVVSTWTVFSSVLFCLPFEKNWKPNSVHLKCGCSSADQDHSAPGKCLDRGATWFANAAINIFTDFVILILPLPILPKIKQPRQQKISLYLIFALGFFVCVVSILRIPSLASAFRSTDPTFDSPGIAEWSIIELNTAIVCACLITLKPLARRFFPRLLGSTNHDVGKERGPGSGPGDGVPATVGSKESGHKANHARHVSDGSEIQLNHDTFGARSTNHTHGSRHSIVESSDLELGLKSIPLDDDPMPMK
ncbi:hypothetical protein GCG54_00012927 [Colletotrichum gloeosporioides]|uniref:Rhodopsin domain-containing protein n=1 Tax=Colletotrichum gloeosporioides TaxID=474922 RepID=A0A8H4CT99_COLGL|nr:uncharacterized protein GCG54_00012927 [Colletotrichum gloeosporioides]KAF3809640.1 hypothetical protein GCG54_00012927 [Colletotrichum gloeosporioides]